MISRKVRAAGYIRMSTDKQETSPEQQRTEIEALAERENATVVEWYFDEGISGDQTEKRLEFKRMIADAEAGSFDVILCWDQDRFGRFDSLEAGYWIQPLRKAGVALVTVTQGRIDWSDFTGRITYAIVQEGKNQYLRDLSKNVTRAMEQLAREGKWVSGVPPIGYVVGEDRRLKLGSPEAVATVKRIFREYLAGGSLRGVARGLTDDGVLSPKGKNWTAAGIKGVLVNPAYLGNTCYNQRAISKYKRKGSKTNDPADWIVAEGTHPPLITRQEHDQVKEILASRKATHSTPHKNGGRFVFSNLLRCGHCGKQMIGSTDNGYPVYVCYSYRQTGKCHQNRINQDKILPVVLGAMKSKIDRDKLLDALQIAVESQGDELAPMEGTRDELLEKIEAAEARLLKVPEDMIDTVAKQIRGLREKLAELETKLIHKQADAAAHQSATDAISQAMSWLDELESITTEDEATRIRGWLLSACESISVKMSRRKQRQKPGKRGAAYVSP